MSTEMMTEGEQSADRKAQEKAKRAIVYLLKRIRSEAHVADAIGYGTESFDLLTEAAAEMCGEPVEKVRDFYAGMGEPADEGRI